MNETTVLLRIKGMDCEGCAQTIGRALKRIAGVRDVQINWKKGHGEIVFDSAQTRQRRSLQVRSFAQGTKPRWSQGERSS